MHQLQRSPGDRGVEGTGLVCAPHAFGISITSVSLRLTRLRASGDLVCPVRLCAFPEISRYLLKTWDLALRV